jgi:hypothetical protein
MPVKAAQVSSMQHKSAKTVQVQLNAVQFGEGSTGQREAAKAA